MDLLDKLKNVKREFLDDEKMIANTFKLEILYKRYKNIIWLSFVFILLITISYFINSYYTDIENKKYNAIYNKLLENPLDTRLLNELKDSKLFDLYTFQKALENSNLSAFEEISYKKEGLLSYLSNYELGSFNRDLDLLGKVDKYSYSDFAKLQMAYILIDENKIKEAKDILDSIPKDSNVIFLANFLSHYLVTKVQRGIND